MAKDPCLKYVMRVTQRDQEIYHEVVIASRKQREVATQFQISQTRVSKIVARVALWLSQTAPYGLNEVPRPQRLYTVARAYIAKLQYYEARALACFDESERREQTTQTFDLVQNPDGKGYVRANGKLSVKPPKADLKYLEAARRYQTMQVEFDGFAKNGQVDTSNQGRLREVPLMTDPELEDGIVEIAAGILEKRRQKEEVRRQKGEVGRQKDEAEEIVGVAEVAKSSAERSVDFPPVGALSDDPAEVALERDIPGPNEFRLPLSEAAEAEPQEAVITEAEVAPAIVAPSPLYSGERVGVRGQERVPGQPGDQMSSGQYSNSSRVPTSAPHPIPLPGVPRRGDQKNPLPGSSLGIPRVPKSGDQQKLNLLVQWEWLQAQRGHHTFSDALSRVPTPIPHYESSPPPPPGYFRDGRFARPIPVMTCRERESPHKKPFLRLSPPKLYELNELTNEWEVAK